MTDFRDRAIREANRPPPPWNGTITVEGERVYVSWRGYHVLYDRALRGIGARWNAERRALELPASQEAEVRRLTARHWP